MSTRARVVAEWIRPHRHLLQGSAAVVSATMTVAFSGLLYWLFAARTNDAAEVGRATALLSSVYFVSYLTNMGLRLAVGRYAIDDSDLHRARFAAACAYTSVTAIVGSIVYLVITRETAAQVLGSFGLVLFVVVAVGASLGPLVDVRQMALRRWTSVTRRAGLVLLGRVLCLVALVMWAPSEHRAVLLFLGAGLPDALSGVIGALVASWRGIVHIVRTRRSPEVREAFRYASVNYLSQLTIQAPLMATPVIVLLAVSPEENAAFYVAWGFFTVALLMPQGLSAALHVEGKKDGADLKDQLRVAQRVGFAANAACLLGSLVIALLIPLVYGQDYLDAARILPWLVAATIPWTVVMVNLTGARVEQRSGTTVGISVLFAAACLIPTVIFTSMFGILGAAMGWLVGASVTAAVAWFLQWRTGPPAPLNPIDAEAAADDQLAAESEILGLS
jgi:O-antigen/teichoic acid export membrane protein